jgi:hypothetical protein
MFQSTVTCSSLASRAGLKRGKVLHLGFPPWSTTTRIALRPVPSRATIDHFVDHNRVESQTRSNAHVIMAHLIQGSHQMFPMLLFPFTSLPINSRPL